MQARLEEAWRVGLDVLVRQLSAGVFINSPIGTPLYLSDRCCEITGVTAEPDGGYPWIDRVHPQDRRRVADAWAATLHGGVPFCESLRYVHPDGEIRWTTVRSEPVHDRDGLLQSYVGTVEDITETRETARTLDDQQVMFDTILANSSDLIVIIDENGKFTFVSEAARRILGQEPDDWVGRDGFELIHPDDVGLAAESLGTTVDSGPGVKEPLLLRVRHADGSWRQVEILTNNLLDVEHVAGLVITARDVSERMVAEANAIEARDRFEQAFDRAPIGMALVANDGRLIRVNEAFAQMLGEPLHQLNGRNLLALAHPEDRRHAIERALAVLSTDDPTPVEVRFVRGDDRIAWARVTSTVIRDPNGAPLHTIAHVEDVTEQRTLRDELEEAATHDPLTGLLNRAGFANRFHEVTSGPTDVAALLLVDLDGFKAVNDTLGHAAGDELLQFVAGRLRSCLRQGDIACRVGGDEFAVLTAEVLDAGNAVAIGERIRAVIANPFHLRRGPARVTGSVGVALLHGPVDLATALATADRASYDAKHGGGNKVAFAWCTELGPTGGPPHPMG